MQLLLSTRKRGKSFLLLLFSLLSSILLFSSQAGTALAAPINNEPQLLGILQARNGKDIPTASDARKLITTLNFDEFVINKAEPVPVGLATFFTSQGRQVGSKIVTDAAAKNLITVGKIFKSKNFLDFGQYKGLSREEFDLYQRAFSRYFAKNARGKAFLVFPHDQTPQPGHVFYDDEMDEIIKSGQVDQIVWLDQKRMADASYLVDDETTQYWARGEGKPDPNRTPPSKVVAARPGSPAARPGSPTTGKPPTTGKSPTTGNPPASQSPGGKPPTTGKQPATGTPPTTGKQPATVKTPATGKPPATVKQPNTGKTPVTGKAPATGKQPATGTPPATGKSPATAKPPAKAGKKP